MPAAAAKNDLISILFRQSIETVASDQDIQQCCTFLPPEPSARSKEESNITAKNARLVTGGSDGVVRIWTVCCFGILFFLPGPYEKVQDKWLFFFLTGS